MNHTTHPFFICASLLVGMIIMIILGRLASKLWNKEENEPKGGVNSLLGALFALSGLILAFAFGMAENHLEKVRGVVETEDNAIGTAVLRADLYSDSVREALRTNFKKYLEAVIDFYNNNADTGLQNKAREEAARAGENLWSIATKESKLPNMLIPSTQMITALNAMFDAATSREIVLESRLPPLIAYTLFACLLASCFVGGFTSAAFTKKEWIITLGFIIIATTVVYTTIDLARPLQGVITADAGKKALIELRKMF